MQLFYFNTIRDNTIVFDATESRHIVRVLRYKKDDLIYATDGLGFIYQARINDTDPDECTAIIKQKKEGQDRRNYSIHIAIAPTKNQDRLEWFVEKSVELGIDSITPIVCEHSERRKIRSDRLYKIMLSAMKQSHKTKLTNIYELMSFNEFVQAGYNSRKYIAHLSESFGTVNLKSTCKAGEDTIIIIGPEGDFSEAEINTALKNNFTPVTLGQSRLRTETAGVTACCLVHFINM